MAEDGGRRAAARKAYRPHAKLTAFLAGPATLSRDGALVACAAHDVARVVRVASGAVERELDGDTEPVTALCWAVDGRSLFVASRSLTVRRYEAATGAVVRAWKPHALPVAALAAHASGQLLATASADRTARVWDIERGYCTHAFKGHGGVVLCCRFHPDPKRLVLFTGGDDASVRVWSLETRKCTHALSGHFSAVTALAVSPCGERLLSAGRDKVVHVWDLRSGETRGTVPTFEALEGIAALAPGARVPGAPKAGDKDALRFATVGERGVLRVWRADKAKCVYEQPTEHAGAAHCEGGFVGLETRPGAAGLVVAAADHRLLFLGLGEKGGSGSDGDDPLVMERELVGDNDDVLDVAFVRAPGDGEDEGRPPAALAVATNSATVRTYDTTTMACTQSLRGHSDIVLCLDSAATKDGRPLLLTGSKDNSLRLWDAAAGRCLATGEGHIAAVSSVAFGRRSSELAVSGGADKLLKVWDLKVPIKRLRAGETGSPLAMRVAAAVAAHDKDINSVAVAPNDSLVCTGSGDRLAKVWRLPELVPVVTLRGHKRGVWSVQFSPIDQCVATASADKTLKVWSISDGSCLRTFEGHTASVLKLAYVSAGTQLVSVGGEGVMSVWTIRAGERVGTFDEHEDKVWALAVAKDGAWLATGGADAMISVWQDKTAEEEDEEMEAQEARLLKEQEMANALRGKDFKAAVELAFDLNKPYNLYGVFKEMLSQEGGEAEARRTVAGFEGERLKQCLTFVREWNTNARFCDVAQRVLTAVLQTHPASVLQEVQGIRELLDGLVPYTQRHFSRLDRLVRSTYLLDFTLNSLSVLSADEETADGDGQPARALSNGDAGPAVENADSEDEQEEDAMDKLDINTPEDLAALEEEMEAILEELPVISAPPPRSARKKAAPAPVEDTPRRSTRRSSLTDVQDGGAPAPARARRGGAEPAPAGPAPEAKARRPKRGAAVTELDDVPAPAEEPKRPKRGRAAKEPDKAKEASEPEPTTKRRRGGRAAAEPDPEPEPEPPSRKRAKAKAKAASPEPEPEATPVRRSTRQRK